MNTNIENSIDLLYIAFSSYLLEERIPGCPHCELDEAESSLHSKPLRDLTWDDLGVFPFMAMTTFGGVNDFKHFLPRILELYIKDYHGAGYDFFIFLSKLEYGKWRTWPHEEQSIVRELIKQGVSTLDPNDKENEYDKSPFEEVIDEVKKAGIIV